MTCSQHSCSGWMQCTTRSSILKSCSGFKTEGHMAKNDLHTEIWCIIAMMAAAPLNHTCQLPNFSGSLRIGASFTILLMLCSVLWKISSVHKNALKLVKDEALQDCKKCMQEKLWRHLRHPLVAAREANTRVVLASSRFIQILKQA